MEELVGPDVEIVLNLKEVTDLAFITTKVLIVATLIDNQMKTDVHEPDTSIRFNIDLIWETNKLNLKKMRNNGVPIKINLFKYYSETQMEKFGYVIVNLRTAQYAPRGKVVKIVEENIKVLGLGKEAKGFSPHLLLSLRVQDKNPESPLPPMIQGNPGLDDVPQHEPKTIEGNPKVKEDVAVPEVVSAEEKPVKYEGGDGTGVQSSPRSPRTRHSITSNVTERRASLTNYEKRNSSGDLQPQKKFVQAFHSYKLKILLRTITWYKVPPKFNFRFHQSRSEVIFTAHPEITIERANEEVELCDIEATFSFVETPSEFFKLLSAVPPIVSIYWKVQDRPTIIARGILESENLVCNANETVHSVDFVEVKSHEVLGRLSYLACLKDCGPQVMKDVTLKLKPPGTVDEGDIPPVFMDTVTDKIVDELEEWKERQKDIFQQKFTAKLKSEIQELRSEWMERKRELEEQLNEKMEQCRQLGSSLLTATEDVKQKNREFVEKEKELEAAKSELEVRYLKLLTDKNEETDKLKSELEAVNEESKKRLARLEDGMKDSGDRVAQLQAENDRLREQLRLTEAELEKNKRACLSQEQTATLLQDLKTMQEKLETANNSKLFFKEQWGRAVREIHRIKSEYTKNIQVQLQYRKDELKKLGLEQLYNSDKAKCVRAEAEDAIDTKDFLGSDFDVRSNISDLDFPYMLKSNYESYKANMDLVRESNSYLLKNNQEHEDRLNKLIEERDKLLCDGQCPIDDEKVTKLNKEIRHLLEY